MAGSGRARLTRMGQVMGEDDDIERNYNEHQLLRRRLPNAWNAFFARFGSLRPIQLNAAPLILAGKNVLVTAPTAGGKTEAVAAPLCERIVGVPWSGLSVLLLTPTRALVNDLFFRLEKPCEHMGVRVGRKTSDHQLSAKISEQLLVTTPESLESLLTFRRNILSRVKAVIIDEIHLLDGGPRGDQLRLLLSRLSAYLYHVGGADFGGLQTVAMSATVPDPRRLADAYLGTDSEIVTLPGQRQLDAKIITADGPVEARAAAAVQAMEAFPDTHKVLVFFNSRKEVDAGADCFRHGAFEHAAVFGHHGSLSKEHRERTEARFKGEGRAVCAATMTLEVGIDIGDVDLVVCMDPPSSLSSFLQRIGRGCRRLAGRTRVLCVARDELGEIVFKALVRQAGLGLPIGPLKPFRASVLVRWIGIVARSNSCSAC
jgi:ATP-dependent Lhr-like helicase